ncbi:hypothetical protein ACKFKG_24395 [Phormidesmis sp. 146-35]
MSDPDLVVHVSPYIADLGDYGESGCAYGSFIFGQFFHLMAHHEIVQPTQPEDDKWLKHSNSVGTIDQADKNILLCFSGRSPGWLGEVRSEE